MAIYFIDYENVGSTGIEDVDRLDGDNVVHIFYSKKADTMKIEQVIQLMNVKAKVEFHDVTMRGQKNALDFQLIAMLYFTKKEHETCFIISKDTGYDAAIMFGKKIGAMNVYRKACILDAYNFELSGRNAHDDQGKSRSSSHEASGERRNRRKQHEDAQDVTDTKPVQEAPAGSEGSGYQADDGQTAAEQSLEKAENEAGGSETASTEFQPDEEQKPMSDAEARQVLADIMKSEEGSRVALANRQLDILEHSFGSMFDYDPVDSYDDDEDSSEPADKEESAGNKTEDKEGSAGSRPAEPAGRQSEPAERPDDKAETGASSDIDKKREHTSFRKTAADQKQAGSGRTNRSPEYIRALESARKYENTVSYERDTAESSGGNDGPAQRDNGDTPETAETETAPDTVPADGAAEIAAQGPDQDGLQSKGTYAQDERGAASDENNGDAAYQENEQDSQHDTQDTEQNTKRRTRRSSSSRGRRHGKDHDDRNDHDNRRDHDENQDEKKPDDDRNDPEEVNAAEDKNSRDDKKQKDDTSHYIPDSPEFRARVTQIMSDGGFDLPEEDLKLIGEALRTTKNKNQFYQFFRKSKGEAAGREFYLKIRGQYENLKVLRDM